VPIKPSHGNVLLVTSVTQNDTWLGGMVAFPELYDDYLSFRTWIYGESMLGGPADCPVSSWEGVNRSSPLVLLNYTSGPAGINCRVYNAPWEYCLAEPAGERSLQCTVSANAKVLLVVLVCNVVKLVCLAATMAAWKFQPLAVIGDAISSFIGRPDSTTEGLGPLSWKTAVMFTSRKMSFQQKLQKLRASPHKWNGNFHIAWRGKPYRWKHAASSILSVFLILL
jgi:hypothetical protein